MSTAETISQDATLRPLPRNTIVPVAGVSFHQDAVRSVSIGDEVVLRHDQSNPYDTDAVAITTLDGKLLGHVPSKADLNTRLLVGHRGGVWGGVVVDKVGEDPVGIRVKIISLLGHRPPGFGADAPGRRDEIAEPVVPTTSIAEQLPSHVQAAPAFVGDGPGTATATVTRMVRTSASRRVLGEYVDEVSSRIRVRGAHGTITAYPAAVVEIYDAS